MFVTAGVMGDTGGVSRVGEVSEMSRGRRASLCATCMHREKTRVQFIKVQRKTDIKINEKITNLVIIVLKS